MLKLCKSSWLSYLLRHSHKRRPSVRWSTLNHCSLSVCLSVPKTLYGLAYICLWLRVYSVVCTGETTTCPVNYVPCRPGTHPPCVHINKLCNGSDSCGDGGSDETYELCGQTTASLLFIDNPSPQPSLWIATKLAHNFSVRGSRPKTYCREILPRP